MAFPKLFQKLFANDGAGPLLRSDIMPIKTVNNTSPNSSGDIVINDYITELSVSEETITYTKKDGTTGTIDNFTANKAVSADTAIKDGNGNIISDTYLTKTDASDTYLGKTDKAVSSTSSDISTKAIQDGYGNNIFNTYAKKSDVTTITSGVEDLTAGTSSLATGTVYFVYE